MNYKIIGKYINCVDFKIPNSKTFFLLQKNIANYKINIDIKSDQLEERIVEVNISLFLKPIDNNFDKISAKVIFSTIIQLDGDINDKKKLKQIILIKVPTEIYPDIRNIFISLFENSGFKQIKIEKNVNFESLQNNQILQ